MLTTTTHTIQGVENIEYIDIVSGEVILGVNAFRDIAAGFSNFFGGRSNAYEEEVEKGRKLALEEMKSRASKIGANAIIGVTFMITGINQGMLIITVSGTAIKI